MEEIPKDTERRFLNTPALHDQLAARAMGVEFDGNFPEIPRPKSLEQLASDHIQRQAAQIAVLQAQLTMMHRQRIEARWFFACFALAAFVLCYMLWLDRYHWRPTTGQQRREAIRGTLEYAREGDCSQPLQRRNWRPECTDRHKSPRGR